MVSNVPIVPYGKARYIWRCFHISQHARDLEQPMLHARLQLRSQLSWRPQRRMPQSRIATTILRVPFLLTMHYSAPCRIPRRRSVLPCKSCKINRPAPMTFPQNTTSVHVYAQCSIGHEDRRGSTRAPMSFSRRHQDYGPNRQVLLYVCA